MAVDNYTTLNGFGETGANDEREQNKCTVGRKIGLVPTE
jgi:hypothetical protein